MCSYQCVSVPHPQDLSKCQLPRRLSRIFSFSFRLNSTRQAGGHPLINEALMPHFGGVIWRKINWIRVAQLEKLSADQMKSIKASTPSTKSRQNLWFYNYSEVHGRSYFHKLVKYFINWLMTFFNTLCWKPKSFTANCIRLIMIWI